MINCLISSSVTRTGSTFLSKNLEQVRGHPARREHFIGGAVDKRTGGDIFHHVEVKLRGLRRQAPPGFAL